MENPKGKVYAKISAFGEEIGMKLFAKVNTVIIKNTKQIMTRCFQRE